MQGTTRMMHIGFTGTQRGMTELQKLGVKLLIPKGSTLHHGDCIGADAEAHQIAREQSCQIILHPPINKSKRAFCTADVTRQPLEYLERNKDIVSESQLIIATPKEYEEQLRSGTWATIRYARKRGKSLRIIYPDGSLSKENV